jgi:hypothetical protein
MRRPMKAPMVMMMMANVGKLVEEPQLGSFLLMKSQLVPP